MSQEKLQATLLAMIVDAHRRGQSVGLIAAASGAERLIEMADLTDEARSAVELLRDSFTVSANLASLGVANADGS